MTATGRPMRILFITNTFPPDYTGGAEVSLYHTSRGLLDRGLHCSVLSVNHVLGEASDDRYDLDDIWVHRVRFATRWAGSAVFDQRVYRAVCREIDALKPDIVHIHNVSGASMAPFVACRRKRTPVAVTLHDMWLICPNNMRMQADGAFCDPARFPNGCGNCFRRYDYWAATPGRRRLFERLSANAALFLVPSQAVIDLHVAAGYDPARFRLVRLGFDSATPAEPSLPAVRRAIELASHYPTIAFSGGGVYNKGAGVVLEAIPFLLERIPTLRILIAGRGDPKTLNEFKRFSPNVNVLGPVPFTDMRSLSAAADLMLLPSIWHENSPVTIFECYQVGTPLVASAIGGIPELIQDGETGYLFAPGDAQAMADRVGRHFEAPPQARRRMRRACTRVTRTELTLENHLSATIAAYEELLNPCASST